MCLSLTLIPCAAPVNPFQASDQGATQIVLCQVIYREHGPGAGKGLMRTHLEVDQGGRTGHRDPDISW